MAAGPGIVAGWDAPFSFGLVQRVDDPNPRRFRVTWIVLPSVGGGPVELTTSELQSYPRFRRAIERAVPGVELPERMRRNDWCRVLNSAMHYVRWAKGRTA